MLIINFIDKDRVQGDEGFSGDSRAVWHARLTLFIGFALMAGGLAGSVVRLPSLYSFREILETQPYPPPRERVSHTGCTGFEIYPPFIPRAIPLLRLRQCLTERRAHVIRHRALDFTKCGERVRVSLVYLGSVVTLPLLVLLHSSMEVLIYQPKPNVSLLLSRS